MEGVDLFSRLPEDCISQILSFTSPPDVGRSATVSSVFRSASESDIVWERFLSSGYSDIIARSVSRLEFSSKKELYNRLCDPIIIEDDHGQLSFSIEKMTGKKCYMLSARKLTIIWGDTPAYWKWTSHTKSRFSEVAELQDVCWLEIWGKIDAHLLSPKTAYKVYLVMNVAPNAYGLCFPAAEMTVKVGGHTSNRTAFLQRRNDRDNVLRGHEQVDSCSGDEQVPKARSDRWKEIEMGEFFNDEGEEGEVEMHLINTKGGRWKRGLVVKGIEIRPS